MKLLRIITLIGCALCLFSVNIARAVPFSCAGTIQYFGADSGGGVTVNIGQGFWAVCSLAISTPTVTKEGCGGWYAMFTSALLSGKTVEIYFDSGANGNIQTCNALGTWVAREPYHIALLP